MKGDVLLSRLYNDSKEGYSEKYLSFLAKMGKVKVPFKLLRNDYKRHILEKAGEVSNAMEKVLGKEKADEFREWVAGLRTKYAYSLPQILGEDFSYNLLTLFFVVFIRYIYDRYLAEKTEKTWFVNDVEKIGLIQDIAREGLWYKKAPTYASRPLSFQTDPKEGRRKGPRIFMVFFKVLLNSDFACGREEDKVKLEQYVNNWLDAALPDETSRDYYGKIENFFKKLIEGDFKKWFEKNFRVELIQNSCLWLKNNRYETILNARCQRSLWISKGIAKRLGLKMNEDELFPHIRKAEKERISEWINNFKKRKYV